MAISKFSKNTIFSILYQNNSFFNPFYIKVNFFYNYAVDIFQFSRINVKQKSDSTKAARAA